ncbi:bfe48028-85c3-4dec-9829-fa7c77296083 [Sclerotinia trifoliorum]|uniref:Bfe48028-85c3-4dec-9829-fa7c77296083 n=1 Tax=Sclerotinia trifoliorum TaxID=28548 RepID=A0A8H2VQM4_9HELO|nr:bfe48028-85c3-4dec-9829-fa7c77296083 [Sclerotinia trifoliorum]
MRFHQFPKWMTAPGTKKSRWRRRTLYSDLIHNSLFLKPTSFLQESLPPVGFSNLPNCSFFSSYFKTMDNTSDPEAYSNIGGSLVDNQHEAEGYLDGLTSGKGSKEIVEDLCSITIESAVENEDNISEEERGRDVIVTPRTYQLEMLEESLKRNIIVAMDTGSGKTHVAVLRILAELERMEPDKLIWFLAPTVALCTQHNEYLQLNISSVLVKLLVGSDGVDRWTEQRQWDAILKDVKIAVSPYQVLLDALTHGFVRMERLSLIIFDEAHNCLNKAPGAKIMTSFYHPYKSISPLPHILGLSASPVMRSDPQSLSLVEETLDAVCRTPKIHQADLRLRVKLPVLSIIEYSPEPEYLITKTVASLGKVITDLNISEDPYVLALKSSGSEKSQRELAKLLSNYKTNSQKELRLIYNTSKTILVELGSWAADYYVSAVVTKYLKAMKARDVFAVMDLAATERVYIAKALKQVEISPSVFSVTDKTSNKVAKLLKTILQQEPPFSAIIFVEERATVFVLAHLLSHHPLTKERFKIGTMVGSSSNSKRTQIVGELVDLDEQKDTLSRFKLGKIDILIATNVLEEGIDVRACNLVICFSKPSNLKSFIQRRGRARQQDSKLILLDSPGGKVIDWHELERNMRKMYEDEMRELQHIFEIENVDEQSEDGRFLRIESTGARLDLDNAVAHLYHFCSVLTAKDFVDLRPDFVYSFDLGTDFVRAKVILPLSVPETFRVHESRGVWLSEKGAAKDAAFEAYVALHKGGLVNDNLLPLMVHDKVIDELTSKPVDTRASLLEVKERLDPWLDVARAWQEAKNNPGIVRTSVMSLDDLKMELCLPIEPPPIPPLTLHWDSSTKFSVEFTNDTEIGTTEDMISRALKDTHLLLSGAFSRRFDIFSRRTVVQFITNRAPASLSLDCMTVPPDEPSQITGFIREFGKLAQPYIFKKWLPSKPPVNEVQHPYLDYPNAPENVPYLALIPVMRRTDFLHKVETQSSSSSKQFSCVLPASVCVQDAMPFQLVQFGMMIPSITHHIEVQLIVDRLRKTILKDLEISDRSLVQTAITHASYSLTSNYQRLEFLGDSILKLCTSVQLVSEYPLWPEGYLSAMKDRIVSNSRSSRAAVELGLDEYIITKKFTGSKWRPMYVEDYLKITEQKRREMSSKVLSDVVEALIGACMVDGGIPKALKSLQLFFPELNWLALETRQMSLYQRAPDDLHLPIALRPIEQILAYTFTKKSLLVEAMTHPSYISGTQSLERLEFLGDAILDNIIVTAMWSHETELSHFQMHLLRSALVNADFLAFLCMEMSIEQDVIDLTEGKDHKIHETHTGRRFSLVNFLRHSSTTFSIYQKQALARHQELREEILAVIKTGDKFPWTLLSRLDARKFFSDMIESLLGAIWIDSGSLDACTKLVERMGILRYMRRILREGVRIMHPKEELGILADSEDVKYVLWNRRMGCEDEKDEKDEKDNRTEGEEKSGTEYLCKVFIGGREIVEVGGGVRKEEIQARAAEAAMEILRGRAREVGYEGDKGR